MSSLAIGQLSGLIRNQQTKNLITTLSSAKLPPSNSAFICFDSYKTTTPKLIPTEIWFMGLEICFASFLRSSNVCGVVTNSD
ncbi:hypothetical protein M8J76_010276 [Diaphorina citri]|nr:hypothetical protein M8J76_010276 [Diaphorina citri]